MKFAFWFFLIPLISQLPANAQKLGYKDFQIGKRISDPAIQNYSIRKMKEDSTRYGLFPTSMSFCEVPLQLILLHVDSLKVIDNCQVHSQEIPFKNFTTFRDKFFEIMDCMAGVFGKPDAIDLDNKQLTKVAYWNLKEVNVLLSLTVADMSTFSENEKRIFVITWAYKPKLKLW